MLHFALQQREENDSFEHFVRIADSFPEPGGVFLLDEAFDGPCLAELGVDGVKEVDEMCIGGGGGVPCRAHVGRHQLASKQVVLPAPILLLGELPAEGRLARSAACGSIKCYAIEQPLWKLEIEYIDIID